MADFEQVNEAVLAFRDESDWQQYHALLLANKLGMDSLETVNSKLAENERKYPIGKSRGRSGKYTELWI